MAEIHVEKKRGSTAWMWVVLLLVAAAIIVWWLWQSGNLGGGSTVVPDTISLEHALRVPSLA